MLRSPRRSVSKYWGMDKMFGSMASVLLVGLGGLVLYRLLQRLRQKACLQDAVVVITGASSGLGKECARVFHAAGAKLILCGRNRNLLQELVEELGAVADSKHKTYTASIVTFDLSKVEEVAQAAEDILKCHGYVDVLINNAGISFRGNILNTHIDVHKEVMEINYFGPIALTQAILPSMVQRQRGQVVVISSIQGKISIPFRSAYAASKHATQAYFDCLRAELEQYGIKVSVLSPGYIRTSLSLNAVTGNGSKYGVLDRNTAEGRDPWEVAGAVLEATERRRKDAMMAGAIPCLAVYIRTLWPSLFFRLMAGRARKEHKAKDQ
ncbi:dehydrogenase/reductase SDR family member 7B isoform X1 [Paramormyrops kingsleyae]|uniref:Dehydrogenase/reductase SDR family member 7B n=1 Tax=Paramormyrops kingsleyae TaxID=1676925 RepID=A0A3B3S851_9TELE|nr:dehydrogenase/reductase SDR family member 7B isoform X1 [Paramormyrops kingsleyae]